MLPPAGKVTFWHEGNKNDYEQARELWSRVMSDEEKKNARKNTAKWLARFNYSEITLYNISPDYASGVYRMCLS
ncbi:catalase-related immune-responsive domain-containing protein [Hirsutella rhossiliensis]|uniref:Catalase-related immune-responsive domain-containing protein n=1 Tax=Hirsutella rhossiliensis TaxID=111463 RepID=A0A9P8SM52_9HYPO|nr:catalase-related immune-responsive domain-containing protein [Hirsutella rhossiliensis]KAH0967621.1 catalase-related immune-responsive domain-containing protein [Hirsutella rhossiliensis]